MTDQFQVNKSDFRNYFFDLISKKILLKIFIVQLISLLILFQTAEVPLNRTNFFLSWIALFALLSFFFLILPSLIVLNRIIKKQRNSPFQDNITLVSDLKGKNNLEIDERKEILFPNSYNILDATRSTLLILTANNHLIFLPKNKIKLEILQAIFSFSNTEDLKNPFRKNIPPYYLVLFCFIPIIGGVVGLIALLLGLVEYKNKILMVIGILGISATAMYFVNVVEKSKQFLHSYEVKKLTAELRLNEIANSIEAYRLVHEVYPSNLGVLRFDELNLIDPFLEHSEKTTNKKFVYVKIDSGYKLFSVGPDGKKSTPDDVYPTWK